MSSLAVREAIKQFLTDNAPTEQQVDFSAEYRDMEDVLQEAGLTYDSNWLALQFIGDREEPVALMAENSTSGLYREYGAIFLHFVGPAMLGGGTPLVARADAVRRKLRAQRLGLGKEIVIEEVSPPNTEAGAALQFESGFMCATVAVSYYRDVKPND